MRNFTIRLSNDQVKKLNEYAEMLAAPVGWVIRRAIDEFFDARGYKPSKGRQARVKEAMKLLDKERDNVIERS